MNEIQTYEKLNDMNSIMALGKAIASSGMFGCEKAEQGTVIALQCVAENAPPLEMAKRYHIIGGKLSKRADSMLADFRKAGGKFVFQDLKNAKEQTALVTFEDYDALKVSYTIKEAEAAGLIRKGSQWEKSPAAMLRARLVSETLRAIAPEIVTGCYTPEELTDNRDGEVMERAHQGAADRKAKREMKAAEVVEDAPKEAKQAEPSGDAPKSLEDKIKSIDKGEMRTNAYWENKGKIQVDLGQTWRDLPQSDINRMESKWEQFVEAALKGGAK